LDGMPSIGRWENEEPAAGQYVYSPADKVDYLKDRLHILGTLCMKPNWVAGRLMDSGMDSGGCFPVDMELWRKYVAKTVTNYRDQVKYWEIWNEPDCRHGDPDVYAELLKIACEEIRKADPHAIVVGAGGITSCPDPDSNVRPIRFGVEIVTKGALKYMDIFSVHLYTSLPEDRDKEQAIGVGFLRKQGFTGEIWNSECMIFSTASWYEDELQCQLHLKAPTEYYGMPIPAVTAAQRQIRHSLIQLGHGITKYFIYWLHESSSLSPGSGGVYTLEYDRIPHPLLFAGAILEDKVAGSKCIGSVMLCGNTVKAVIFSKGQGAWLGLWAYKEGDKATLRLPEKGKWRITDVMDNDIVGGSGKEGVLAVELTSSPIYIENQHMDAQSLKKTLMEYNK